MVNPYHLEAEAQNVLALGAQLIAHLPPQNESQEGRPRSAITDILKSLLVMSYFGMSYRRSEGVLRRLASEGYLATVPKRSTLNKYALDPVSTRILEQMVHETALAFIDVEDVVVIDSTWFSHLIPMSTGHSQSSSARSMVIPSLKKCRKLHVACFRHSKLIIYAKATAGTISDVRTFPEVVASLIERGFRVRTLIADKGYCSKDNYAFCQKMGINDVFIDFKSNCDVKRAKSNLWRQRLLLQQKNPDLWHETYRLRVVIESLFSAMKRKGKQFIRSRRPCAQDAELLLRVLWYNLAILAKHQR